MFVTAENGGAIPVQPAAGQPTPRPIDFLAQYGSLFGITNTSQMVVRQTTRDALGFTHTTYRQVHQGISVFGGTIKVHQNAAGQITAANGYFFPISSKLRTTAAVSAAQAQGTARAAVERGNPSVERSELVIVDPGWYGDRFVGSRLAHHIVLADSDVALLEGFFIDAHTGRILDQWTMLPTAKERQIFDFCGASDCCCEHDSGGCGNDACELAVCEVDPTCCSGDWTESCAIESFFVCSDICGAAPLARSEGDPVVLGKDDVNAAYDYFGDTYDYYFRAFGRDGINDRGLTLVAGVNFPFGCPNAFWDGFFLQMIFCPGLTGDEIIGHELTHGVTQFTADLLYQNQSGQLNESFSDVFGELIDLFNGDAAFAGTPGGTPWPTHPTGPGVDKPNNRRAPSSTSCSPAPGYPDGVRWLIGEDVVGFGGAIRDMWNPTCFGDPDRANSAFQTCSPFDSGGVHGGSGVPNHAFAIITDGKTFNGLSVTGIGPIKSGAVWYRSLTEYLTEISDFQAAYAALNQAAADLVDTTPNDPRTGLPSDSVFTAADAAELDKALRAVEMDTPGRCGKEFAILSTAPPTACGAGATIFLEDFEESAEAWSVGTCTQLVAPRDNPSSACDENSQPPPTPYHWARTAGLPQGREGTAMFAADPDLFDFTADESAVHELISPEIALPAGLVSPTLSFAHYMNSELGYDGGTVQIKVDDGEFKDVVTEDFLYNPYTTFLFEDAFGNSNPLQGSRAWSGAGGWGTTLINLASSNLGARSGSTIQIKFRFGKDAVFGVDGWYVDDVHVLDCDCNGNGLADAQDIASGASQDCQPNGVPDECEGGCVLDPGGGGALDSPKVPTVSIQVSPLSGLSPLTVSFRANAPESDSAIVSTVWDFGDGSTPDNRAVTEHTYRLSGTATESFQAIFTATDEEGDVGQRSVLITVFSGVEEPPDVSDSAVRIVVRVPGTSTDVGDSAALGERLELSVDTSQILGTPQGISWSLGDGTTASSFIVQHTYELAGTFPISVVVSSQTSSGDTITFPASRLITILAPANSNDNAAGNTNDNSGQPSGGGGGGGGVACGMGLLMPMLGMFGLAVVRRLRLA